MKTKINSVVKSLEQIDAELDKITADLQKELTENRAQVEKYYSLCQESAAQREGTQKKRLEALQKRYEEAESNLTAASVVNADTETMNKLSIDMASLQLQIKTTEELLSKTFVPEVKTFDEFVIKLNDEIESLEEAESALSKIYELKNKVDHAIDRLDTNADNYSIFGTNKDNQFTNYALNTLMLMTKGKIEVRACGGVPYVHAMAKPKNYHMIGEADKAIIDAYTALKS